MESVKSSERPPTEIERKFLVTQLPELIKECPKSRIQQGYLMIAADGSEVRLRQVIKGPDFEPSHFITIKSAGDIKRTEMEAEISAEVFDDLWPLTAGRRLVKDRHYLADETGSAIVEIDIFTGELAGLILAEVEFPSINDAQQFQPPAWFGPEVTDNSQYKNQNLAQNGLAKNL